MSVLIVGGGVSGLATAYYLSRYGISSTIIEKSRRTGGLIQTDIWEGCRLEAGPDSYIATKPAVTELAAELRGLEVIGSNDAARRIFVVRDGKLCALPKGMVMMVPGDEQALHSSDIVSAAAKKRIHEETSFKPLARANDISVGELVSEHFGPEVLEYLTEPLLCGVYGGDSEQLSAESVLPRFMGYERKYGSLVKGVREELQKPHSGSLFLSLRDGMQSLTDLLSGHAPVIRAEATSVMRHGNTWRVAADGQTYDASNVVLCCPAHVNARLLESDAPTLAEQMAAIPYSSAILVMLVFRRDAIDHALDGFGFLVPRSERRTIAAATWVNTKFPSRIRPDLAALRAFIVGSRAEELANASESEVLSLVRDDFQRFMGIDAQPVFHTYHAWPRSMPQYVVGHNFRTETIFQEVRQLPGLFLVGNAYDGVGIPDCVRRARSVAERICERNV